MTGRHSAEAVSRAQDDLVPYLHDVCPCGRRAPQTMRAAELRDAAIGQRLVWRAAAKLRIVTDRRLLRLPTPEWVLDLAHETGEPVLSADWQDRIIADLAKEARRRCTCICHGLKTQSELDGEALQQRNLNRAGARLQQTLDARLSRKTTQSILLLAAEDDE